MKSKAVIHLEEHTDGKGLLMQVTGNSFDLAQVLLGAMLSNDGFREVVEAAIMMRGIADKEDMKPEDLIRVREMTEKEFNAS